MRPGIGCVRDIRRSGAAFAPVASARVTEIKPSLKLACPYTIAGMPLVIFLIYDIGLGSPGWRCCFDWGIFVRRRAFNEAQVDTAFVP
jgi:hypothetical protein